jgi:hypothetical protein
MSIKKIINKIHRTFIAYGLFFTFIEIVLYPLRRIKKLYFDKNILSLTSREDKFTWIYYKNYWGSTESKSGGGSTLLYTTNLRKEIPILINIYSVKSVFDAPCGDFNWMKSVLSTLNIIYIGGDIVAPLIKNLNEKYKSPNINFIHFDIINNIPPKTDMLICRDCLFHFSFVDSRLFLLNFIKSETKFLLTTTHLNKDLSFSNKDINTGDFRLIDLYIEPYNFSVYPLYVIDDWIFPHPPRQMCLWSRDQIIKALQTFKA